MQTKRKEGLLLCSWRGFQLLSRSDIICGNFTVNTTHDKSDYTLEYHRVNNEDVTNLVFYAAPSSVGVTIDWTKEGVSPDVIECEKYAPQTSSTH
nr:hypothetical transcript [Hymenolepis microstoma]